MLRVLHAGLEWSWWGKLEPNCLDDPTRPQIAGGETAFLRAAFETAARGHHVAVATWCYPGTHRGVAFHPKDDFYRLVLDGGPWDAVVLWGGPEPFAALTALGAVGPGGALRVVSQQCNGFERHDGGEPFVDLYVSPSRGHAARLSALYRIPAEKFRAIPNAVEPLRYRPALMRERDPFAVYHASSPDRGLHHLLEKWPEIKAREPRAHLHVYYELDRFLASVDTSAYVRPSSDPGMIDLAGRIRRARDRVALGWDVTFHGARPQQEVADRACTSGVMCYPCDPVVYTEGYGTAVLEAYVAGAVPVTTDADAFGEVYGGLFPLLDRRTVHETVADAVVEAMREAESLKDNDRLGHAFRDEAQFRALAERYSWARVGEAWCEMIEAECAKRAERRVACPTA